MAAVGGRPWERVATTRRLHAALLLVVLIGAFGLRVWNIDWDEGQHQHPDERFWNIVTDSIEAPDGLTGYFDSASSPLNPYQHNPTFVYGTGPLFLTKATSWWLHDGVRNGTFPANTVARLIDTTGIDLINAVGEPTFDSGYNSHLIGRLWSALFDVATVLVAYGIGRHLFGRTVALVAAGAMATTALSIQYSHFYGAETIATFFVTASAYGALRLARARADWRWILFTGATLGLAIASKLNSVVAVAPVVAALFLVEWFEPARSPRDLARQVWPRVESGILVALAAVVAFRLAQPYAFTGGLSLRFDQRFTDDLSRLAEIQSGVDFPPNIQWVDRVPLLYPLSQLFRWGLGPPLTIAALVGIASLVPQLRRGDRVLWVPLSLIVAMLAVIATSRTPTLRYMLPIYPLLAVMAAKGITTLWRSTGRVRSAPVLGGMLMTGAVLWGLAFTAGVYGTTHSRIAATEWMAENIPSGSAVSAQAWDDALPLRLPSVADFQVEVITLEPYATDSPLKVANLIAQLNQVDYVIESSNRLYDSVTRIPARYPSTTAYYDALFAETLGFEIVAQFSNPPSLFGVSIDDSGAEEAFTVYDHPTVTIWRKTADFSTDLARSILDPQRARSTIGVIPRDADANALMLRPDDYQRQQAGGDFDSVFTGLGNRAPALWWFLFLEVAALSTVPWITWLFGRLPGSGYGLTKFFGLLAVALPVWVLVAWDVTTMSRPLLWVCWIAVVGIGAGIGWRRREQLGADFARNRTVWLLAEAVFVAAFMAVLWLRASNPDLWHPFRGGEKPMELAYLTAVTKSSTLPPYDPWFAGGSLNYFYFGYFLLAVPIRALGVLPEIGFNLGVATYAAMTAAAVFAGVAALVDSPAHRSGSNTRTTARRRMPCTAGLIGVMFLLVGGNLAIARQQVTRLRDANRWQALADAPIVGSVVEVVGGTWQWLRGVDLAPIDWWAASRVNHGLLDITEFPAWSFLFGDLHAHVMDVVVLVSLVAVATLYVVSSFHLDNRRSRAAVIGLGLMTALVRMTNTWDLPTSVLLAAMALAIGQAMAPGPAQRRAMRAVRHIVVMVGVNLIIVWPYIDNSQVFDGGLEVTVATTPLSGWLTQFGLFLFATVSYLSLRFHEHMAMGTTRARPRELAIVGGQAAVLGSLLALGFGPVAGFAGLLAIIAAYLLLFEIEARVPNRALVAALFAAGHGIVTGVEIVRVQDDIERFNTVFKFWYQAWTLLAIAGATGLSFVARALYDARRRAAAGSTTGVAVPARPDVQRGLRILWALGAATLITASLSFPLLATRPRLDDRFQPLAAQLDGLAYLRADPIINTDTGPVAIGEDLVLIEWLRDNVDGSPTIVETVGPNYQWPGRFAIYTGLPTVVGWETHQSQQRRIFAAAVTQRRSDTATFWSTPEEANAVGFLQGYDVSYIVVGSEELRTADPLLLEMLPTLQGVTVVFEVGDMRIYKIDKRAIRGLAADAVLGPLVADSAPREDIAADRMPA